MVDPLAVDQIREAYFYLTDVGNGNNVLGTDDMMRAREIAQNMSNIICDAQQIERHPIEWEW